MANTFSRSSRTKKDASADTRSRDEQHAGLRKFTLGFLSHLLLQYPNKDRQAASDMVGGFQEAMNDIDNLDMNDKDKMFEMLYLNIITLQRFRGIQPRLAAITLANFFLKNFKYLPTASIPLIERRSSTSRTYERRTYKLRKYRKIRITTTSIDPPEKANAIAKEVIEEIEEVGEENMAQKQQDELELQKSIREEEGRPAICSQINNKWLQKVIN